MTSTVTAHEDARSLGTLQVLPFAHPQGCRTYLVADSKSGKALALDPHLDLVDDVSDRVRVEGWELSYVVETHTHADHPSGAAALAARCSSTRVAHEQAQHAGVTRHPADGERPLGDASVLVRHAPGHTPDHIVLIAEGALFSGDSLFIGGVARADFLGGDAGVLFDSIHRVVDDLPDDTVLFPGHDYEGRISTTLGQERSTNAWLRMRDRSSFVTELTRNPPPRPANMDDLLRLNRSGVGIPSTVSAVEAVQHVKAGGATSVIDVRTGAEFEGEHIAGSRLISLDELNRRAHDVRMVPAPRLLLCRTGSRAETARQRLEKLHIGGLTVIEGGIEAFRTAGGATEKGRARMSIERQVRIGAGALSLIGVALGAAVHPGFLGIAAFVGAGLVFAGLTDWCGMGLLLAKAPWNRARGARDGGAGGGPPASCAAHAAQGAPAGCAAGAPQTPDSE